MDLWRIILTLALILQTTDSRTSLVISEGKCSHRGPGPFRERHTCPGVGMAFAAARLDPGLRRR